MTVIFFSAFFAACKKDSRTRWDADVLVPLLNTNLSLQNLVKDSTIRANADSSLVIAFNKTLYELNLANQIVHIPDTAIGQKFSLDSLKLPSETFIYNLSLGTLALNMAQSSDPGIKILGQYILANDSTYNAVGGISGFSSNFFHFNGAAFFQKATLSQGTLYIGVNNYLPVALQDIRLELRNTSDGSLVLSHTIPYIAAGDSTYEALDIAGKTIEGAMDIKLVNLNSLPSNGPVFIDTGDYVKLYMSVQNLHASDAIAIFPAQDIVSITQEVTQEIGDRRLTYIDARQGQLHVKITSAVQQPLELTYILEGAYDKTGRPLSARSHINAAQPGVPVTIDNTYDVSGFAINLTGKNGSKFNTYTQTVIAHTDSTGVLAHVTLADSLNIEYRIENIAPNYIKGYAGRDTVTAIDTAGFDFLNIFKSGTIDLERVNMNINVENGLGIDGEIKINSMKARSANNGDVTLGGSIIGQPLTIHRATDFPLSPAISNFPLNNGNSNITNFLGILPNSISYNVFVKTNINGNNQQYRDFAYLESALKLSLNAEIPLSLIANHLLLKDTIAFNLGNNTSIAGISDGTINLIAENRFPIEAMLNLVVYDDNWVPVDTLVSTTMVAAADLNNNCRAYQPKRTKIPLYVTEERMNKLKQGKHAIVTSDFSTASNNATCNGQHLKIYSDYSLGITLTARFNYKVITHF